MRTRRTERDATNQVVAPHELAADAALVDTWAQTPCPNMSLGIRRFCSTSNGFTVKFALFARLQVWGKKRKQRSGIF